MQENQNNPNQEIEVDENHLIQIRKDKLKYKKYGTKTRNRKFEY